MLVIFCLDPLNRRRPDDAYAAEAAACDRLGISWTLIDHDAVVRGEADRVVRGVAPRSSPVVGVYRGWMMAVERYALFYQALGLRGVRLVNDPAAYRHGHHLPESYPVLEGSTPRTVWLPIGDGIHLDRIMDLLLPFGDAPLVLKDYVKSQKHAWEEACFIPSASDHEAVGRVVRRFLGLQGPDLIGGLVFREYVDLEPVGRHPRSGMPLTREYRLFFLDGRPLLCAEYWDEGDYQGGGPPVERLASLAARVRSRFFTMDVARRKGGDWIVVELGDGQVAGMPEKADVEAFYRGLVYSLRE